MKQLKDILYRVGVEAVYGSTDIAFNNLVFDSRKVSKGDVFTAISGTQVDGHKFITQVEEKGVVAVVCEVLPGKRDEKVTYVLVKDSKEALAFMADNFYDNPSQQLKLVGVTGTNGKTTIASLLYSLFKKIGFKAGLLSTVRVMVDNKEFPATHTTPDSLSINDYLHRMVKAGVTHGFMEVSSHGIHQQRSKGLHFTGGVFTNLTHDHLDYHKSFAEYRDVKKSFFDELPKSAFALVNIDDKNGKVMVQNTEARTYTYALKTVADYKAKILENQLGGLLLVINGNEVWTKLIGTFNAYNLLAIYGVVDLLGIDTLENLRLLSELESVSGRFQYLISDEGITAIVDYAHTPDALKNVLETINAIRTNNEQLITVVGCGGDRDKAKRPVMGNIATQLSNKVIFTSDNPRSEDPEVIIHEMEAGVEPQHVKKTLVITDRRQTYQEIKGVKTDFDDYKIVTETLKALHK